MEIRPVGAKLYAERRTDWQAGMTKLIFAIRNFANAPKNFNTTRIINFRPFDARSECSATLTHQIPVPFTCLASPIPK